MPKSRSYCFTSFEENYQNWIDESTQYLIIGREVCPTTGRQHWQGYAYFKNPVGFNRLKRSHPGDHIERARGSPKDNVLYCSKEAVEFERGEAPAQGRRTDLELIKVDLDAGCGERDISDRYFKQWVQYRRSFERYRRIREPTRDWNTELIIIWGPTGTGKTRQAIADGAEPILYTESGFILGYTGQPTVLFDDWPEEPTMGRSLFLKLFDRYPCIVNVKGGSRNWIPKRVYITTNFDPHMWYRSCEAVERRVTEYRHQVENWVPPIEVIELEDEVELQEFA